MTTPNEELIDALADAYASRSAFRERYQARAALEQAMQSQAERIKELELDLDIQAGSIEAVQAANSRLAAERDTLRAQIAALAATEPVCYEFQWTNPGNQPHQPESMFVWARVEPAWNGTVQQKVDELLAYRYDDKPTYRVRALFTRPMPAQDVEASMIKWPEPVELNPAANSVMGHSDATLKQAVRDALDTQGVTELVEALEALIESTTGVDQVSVVNDARTALSKYKGGK